MDPVPEAWGFGDSPQMADELGQLVVSGKKWATCSLLLEYTHEGESLPEPGQLSIILDGRGEPLCIIETTSVKIQAYNKVDADFAYEEGEGDRSLRYWREAHHRFFTRQCQQMDQKFTEDAPLVCERFRVLYAPVSSENTPEKS